MAKLKLFESLGLGRKKRSLTDNVSVVSILDTSSTYPSKGLTPERLATLLREADSGDVTRQMELFEEMLEKDAHLFSLFQRRRLRVAGRSYEIIPASEDAKDVEIASEAREMISRLKGWSSAVSDLLDAVPKGFSVLQLQWAVNGDRYDIVQLRHIHQKKFRFGSMTDLDGDPEQLRLLIEPRQLEAFRAMVSPGALSDASVNGLPLDVDPLFRRRFAVLIAKSRSGSPARTSLLRTCVYAFLFKNYDVKWWVQFAEILLGFKVGKYDPNETGQIDTLKQALRGLSMDSTAVISKNSEIEFKEMLGKASSHQVYKELKEWCNEEMSKAVLGHSRSSDATPGALGQETSAQDASQELVEADALLLDETISDEILRPWVEMNYGPQEKYPYYKTRVEPEEDLVEKANLIVLLQRAGKTISSKYVDEVFGIPSPDPTDKDDLPLVPLPQAASPLGAMFQASDGRATLADIKKKILRLMN
jgi:phage gp29-like protein